MISHFVGVLLYLFISFIQFGHSSTLWAHKLTRWGYVGHFILIGLIKSQVVSTIILYIARLMTGPRGVWLSESAPRV